MKNYSLLSTKTLHPAHKEVLHNAGVRFTEYDAISIKMIDFTVKNPVKNAIITSRNAARAIVTKKTGIKNCFCVGEKTTAFLKENGLKVVETGQNALDLAQKIVKKHKNGQFTFFCGDRKRAELPDLLKTHHIALNEIEVYKTQLHPRKIEGAYDAILFFSPSAVESHFLKNTIGNSTAFCIGATTASEAKKYTQHINIAGRPTIENVLAQAVQHKNT